MTTAKTKKRNKRKARLDLGLNPEAKERIEQAVVSHRSVNDFVVTSRDAFEKALKRRQIITLNNHDRDFFLAATGADVKPNRALHKAAVRFKKLYQ